MPTALESRTAPVAPEAESARLHDGGEHAYPRMLEVIRSAHSSVFLEVYAFALDSVGEAFVQALSAAARRGVRVDVILDGWGSLMSGRRVAALLRQAGANARIYNRFRTLFLGRFRRDHRKILLVDDRTAFIGGINIGEAYADNPHRPGWTDLAVELHGEPVRRLAARLRGEPNVPRTEGSARIYLSGLGEAASCTSATSRPSTAPSATWSSPTATFSPGRGCSTR